MLMVIHGPMLHLLELLEQEWASQHSMTIFMQQEDMTEI
jgi:hypothetical protein